VKPERRRSLQDERVAVAQNCHHTTVMTVMMVMMMMMMMMMMTVVVVVVRVSGLAAQ